MPGCRLWDFGTAGVPRALTKSPVCALAGVGLLSRFGGNAFKQVNSSKRELRSLPQTSHIPRAARPVVGPSAGSFDQGKAVAPHDLPAYRATKPMRFHGTTSRTFQPPTIPFPLMEQASYVP